MLKLRVKEVAQQKGIANAAELSRETKVAYATAYRLWNGDLGSDDKGVGVLVLYRVARALNVKLLELVEESGPKMPARKAA